MRPKRKLKLIVNKAKTTLFGARGQHHGSRDWRRCDVTRGVRYTSLFAS